MCTWAHLNHYVTYMNCLSILGKLMSSLFRTAMHQIFDGFHHGWSDDDHLVKAIYLDITRNAIMILIVDIVGKVCI